MGKVEIALKQVVCGNVEISRGTAGTESLENINNSWKQKGYITKGISVPSYRVHSL
jgi:hypothetical protein